MRSSLRFWNVPSLFRSRAPACAAIIALAALTGLAAPSTPADAGTHAAPSKGSSAASSAHHASATVTPGEALEELLAGNQRFVAGAPSHPSQDPARRAALAAGQTPRAIILSCSDSRVPPELVFDRGLGEIFVVRVAGNVLGIASTASIEYAVEHLGCPLIVVMGHESCGAVKAALTVMPDDAGSSELGSLVAAIRTHVKGVKEAALADPTLTPAVKANVDGVAAQLATRSKIVREHVEHGGVKVVRAIYHLDSGEVEFWEAAPPSVASRGALH